MHTMFRLVVQSRDHHPWGVYSGTSRLYVLQCRETEADPWKTLPVVDFDKLSDAEKKEIASSATV
jgi:hypothetical protein